MKALVQQLITDAITNLQNHEVIPRDIVADIKITHSKEAEHGDFATNIALAIAKACHLPPRQLAEQLVEAMNPHAAIAKIEIAGPGFINFFLQADTLSQVISEVLSQRTQFGQSSVGQGQKVILEFVSANPTGPLHVGHGRSAAFGASLANILKEAGFKVHCEYYVNDAGRQMNILAVSVWLRYLELAGVDIVFPANGYRGLYVQDIAKEIFDQSSSTYVHAWPLIIEGLPLDEPAGGDKEQYIDALIERARVLLGEQHFNLFHQHALNSVLADIKQDLAEFNVDYDCWFSERSLHDDGAIEKGIAALEQSQHTYSKAGALWFKAAEFGDEKDRVLVRANGQTTYFAADVAYHWHKYNRGFERVIDIFGADHHGYVTRVKAAVKALGHNEQALDILLVQFALLYRGRERVQMSTRSGSFVTLRELRNEVGNDAARFFYVLRKAEQHMDFDLELAKSQSSDNPVYYIQYAHARIASVLRQLGERNIEIDEQEGLSHAHRLTEPHEVNLITLLNRYPELIKLAAEACEPHQLAYYLRELANGLHSYYNAVHLICEDKTLRSARICLLKAVQQVIHNGLKLLGVSAPESM